MSTTTTEPASTDILDQIRDVQRAQAEDLKVIKGQLTDLPGMKTSLARTRLDLRQDVSGLREQAAELPGIRTRLEEQDRALAEIKGQLATIITLLQGETTAEAAERPCPTR